MINTKPNLKSTFKACLYISPLLIITCIFTIWPLFQSILMSWYTRYNYYTGQVHALGWANFIYLWHDATFHLAIRNTLIFVLGVVPITVSLALGIAIGVTRMTHFNRLLQTIYFLPFVTSSIAITMVWRWLFRFDNGLLNTLLNTVGVHPINWLNDPHYSLFALIVVCIWHNLGLNIILFLASLSQIDHRYYLTAQLDGASNWQQFTLITWPLLMPMIILVTINAIITNFKVFDQVYALFNGHAGPANADLTMMYYLYQKFYVENQPAIAAASGVVLFGFIIFLTILTTIYLRHQCRRFWEVH